MASRGKANAPRVETSTEAETPAATVRGFVVQHHRATHDHYDFRLQVGDALASWAVPKGPTLDPKAKRSAFRVGDHPMEYFDFEGVIPEGEYGGGDVVVWDIGTWEPHGTDDPASALESGELHAELHGHKLQGRFVLIRRGEDRSGREQWLLVHKRDVHAVDAWDPADHPKSVLSGRTNEEVAEHPERFWRGDWPAVAASVPAGREAALPSDEDLAQLDELGDQGTWEIFGRRLRVTNLDKVLFPADDTGAPVTKREFLRYAARIAPVALPYLAGRALNMHRYPNGATSKGFWHKEVPNHAPQWVTRWDNPEADPGETRTYLRVDEPATLVWVANFGALEWHAWTSFTDEPHQPTYALIDIDPGEETTWDEVLLLARLHRDALQHLKVTAQPQATGRRGIQIWVPIKRGPDFDDTRAWVEALSRTVGAVVPELVSWKWEVRRRGGRARLDYTQNAINKTLISPYSTRPSPGATVATPIDWDELDDPGLRPDGFTIESVIDRLRTRGDPFRSLLRAVQSLPRIR
jgi:bifunctional non-homologous end joining protein LigD